MSSEDTTRTVAATLADAQLLQSPETVADVRAAALNEGADAVEAMQTARDDEANAVLRGLPDRTAAEHVTSHRAAALLRQMAGNRHGRSTPSGLCPSNTPSGEPDTAHWCVLPEGHESRWHVSRYGTVWTDHDAEERNPARALSAAAVSAPTSGTCGRASAQGQPWPDHPVAPSDVEQLRARLGEAADTVARVEQVRVEREKVENALRARVLELEGQLAKYVGKEPTIAEEMAYLSRCLDNVRELCDEAERQATQREQPMPVPEWVAAVREAAAGDEPRRTYPPAMPWAVLMDDEDLHDFLDELAASAITHASNATALAEVEATCGRWRAIAEAQHAHNIAPGPDRDEAPDGITRLIVPMQAMREDEAAGVKLAPSAESPTTAGPEMVYRASYESIVMGLYATREAARAHCEAEERANRPTGTDFMFAWIPDDSDPASPEELSVFVGQNEESTTGFVVTPLEVASAYNPEADT